METRDTKPKLGNKTQHLLGFVMMAVVMAQGSVLGQANITSLSDITDADSR